MTNCNKFNLRPAKKKDFDFFFKDDPVKYSSKAWVLSKNKDRIAIGGLWLIPGQYTSFIKVRNGVAKKQIWIASLKVHEQFKDVKYPIFSIRDTKIPNSNKFLERLGYQFIKTKFGKEVYIWQK